MTTQKSVPRNDIGAKLATRQQGGEVQQRPRTFAESLEALKPQLELALPEATNLTSDRLCRLVMTEMRNNPLLAQCEQSTVFGAMMRSASLGLEIGLEGRAYLVPYRNRKKNTYECQFIIGYRGELELVRRSGECIGIPKVRLVYANDLFDMVLTNETDSFQHTPWYARKEQKFTEPGEVLGGYLVVRYKDGGSDFFFTPMYEIEKHRKRSMASDNGPWKTDFEAMCMKTVVRANFKWLPSSVEKADIAAVDGKVSVFNPDLSKDIDEIRSRPIEIEIEGDVVDKETGEIIDEATDDHEVETIPKGAA